MGTEYPVLRMVMNLYGHASRNKNTVISLAGEACARIFKWLRITSVVLAGIHDARYALCFLSVMVLGGRACGEAICALAIVQQDSDAAVNVFQDNYVILTRYFMILCGIVMEGRGGDRAVQVVPRLERSGYFEFKIQ